jgi:hypothetical protein
MTLVVEFNGAGLICGIQFSLFLDFSRFEKKYIGTSVYENHEY